MAEDAEAAGLSLHARIMAELGALGIAPGEVPGRAGARSRGAGAADRAVGEGNAGDEDAEGAVVGGRHHLYHDRKKGWLLRVTVDVGKHVIGKRLKFNLRTHDLAEAEKARVLVLATLKKLGLTVRLRVQGRRGR